MKITLLASFLVMAAYFLLLYAGVGLIQEKKFFSSAPREVFAAVPERKAERFRGAHILGWCLGILAMLLFLGAAVLAAWDGVRNGFTIRVTSALKVSRSTASAPPAATRATSAAFRS